jgi:hypothetical protein
VGQHREPHSGDPHNKHVVLAASIHCNTTTADHTSLVWRFIQQSRLLVYFSSYRQHQRRESSCCANVPKAEKKSRKRNKYQQFAEYSMEAEMQDPYDPANDPEEQKLILSVLDSFRYTSTCITKIKSEERVLIPKQLVPPPCSLQWHTPPPPRLLLSPTSSLDTAIPPTFLHSIHTLPSR